MTPGPMRRVLPDGAKVWVRRKEGAPTGALPPLVRMPRRVQVPASPLERSALA